MSSKYGAPQPYYPPDWAKELSVIPKTRIKLAQLPTPIHSWSVPGLPDGFQLYIKRDDLTGSTLSGNKVRKLEFIFSEALDQGCDTVITGGGLQSNHTRATAVVAKELGLSSLNILYLPPEKTHESSLSSKEKGNLLLSCMVGATSETVPFLAAETRFKQMEEYMKATSDRLIVKGHLPCIVELGGANPTGAWGYIEAFQEMIDQGILENFDDIVMCAGTGGTALGIGLASYLTGSKLKVHAVCTKAPSTVVATNINKELSKIKKEGMDNHLQCSDIVDLIDLHTDTSIKKEDLDFLTQVSTKTGIILDTTFTLKTVICMLHEMKYNPERFRGQRILFMHTGGLFGLCDGQLDPVLVQTPDTNRIRSIHEFIDVV
ncbi:PREDICTED: bifunctional D-cysteine desulfhydrase/1-aminocyclopropane-1-carboxylate deaminase, mitochondrial-like [Amphimedon queenslandica]|uniref:Tryptophan synthase beta chain-like PALP domain-containing protein n=1 Tax=Amphimedon queenslandica TaxID=400682 RepID=A0A1X7VMD5_AMPQE|nr:PREDICTED: bifunctional D-cysteine desulfhydrase/1-aminocyclopropane-1-carboxylate deaminase, mitochondrial-like [Amphimedon queenslandica]|eukprot:XP_003383705.1 PREDICTED: bifunctional D-cysteine desulfhydrase/1-aminocyclopropane-1-carboxylate deaminase, mitochondrial-like [Amphimedon queenslandica]